MVTPQEKLKLKETDDSTEFDILEAKHFLMEYLQRRKLVAEAMGQEKKMAVWAKPTSEVEDLKRFIKMVHICPPGNQAAGVGSPNVGVAHSLGHFFEDQTAAGSNH